MVRLADSQRCPPPLRVDQTNYKKEQISMATTSDKPFVPGQTIIVKLDEIAVDGISYVRYELVDADGMVPNPYYDSSNRKKDAEPKLIRLATTDVDGEQVFVTAPGKYHATQRLEEQPAGTQCVTETWFNENILGILPEEEVTQDEAN
jgi:hypothetical protein